MIAKLIQVEALDKFQIRIKYFDGTEGIVDLSYLADKPIFQSWKDGTNFFHVYINKETNAIAWNEDIELCPDSLYLKIKGISFETWKKNNNSYATNQ